MSSQEQSRAIPDDLARSIREKRYLLLTAQVEAETAGKPWWSGLNLPVLIPIMSVIVTGLIGIVGSLGTENIRLKNELEIAQFEREANLIVEAAKTGSKDTALANLDWLIEAGLVSDADGLIRDLIEQDRSLVIDRADLLQTIFTSPLTTEVGQVARAELIQSVDDRLKNRCAGLPEPSERIIWWLKQAQGFVVLFSCVRPSEESPDADDYIIGVFNDSSDPVSIGFPWIDDGNQDIQPDTGLIRVRSYKRNEMQPIREAQSFSVRGRDVSLKVFSPDPIE